jgi:uncharacterized protein (TIGR02646 family)
MNPFKRAAEPAFLIKNWESWGREWEDRKAQNPSARFHWHQINGTPVNQLLLPMLKEQTQAHCSFCDAFPVAPPSIDTIEHFRPKSKYPRIACKWDHLYYCCDWRQQKGDGFDEALLKPDDESYSFDRYFRWDYTQGLLMINERATPENQKRAEAVIVYYKLNEGHPSLRKRELRRRSRFVDDPLDDFAYRNFVDASSVSSVSFASAQPCGAEISAG